MARDDACNCFCVMQTCGTNHTEHTSCNLSSLLWSLLSPVTPNVSLQVFHWILLLKTLNIFHFMNYSEFILFQGRKTGDMLYAVTSNSI